MLLVEVAPHDPEMLTSCPLAPDEQEPNASWQPSSQYAEVLPQKPLEEQQLPNVEVRHVAFVSELEPQLPSLLVGFARGRMREEDELGPVRGVSSGREGIRELTVQSRERTKPRLERIKTENTAGKTPWR